MEKNTCFDPWRKNDRRPRLSSYKPYWTCIYGHATMHQQRMCSLLSHYNYMYYMYKAYQTITRRRELTGNMWLRKTSKTGLFLRSCGRQWRSRNTVPCIIRNSWSSEEDGVERRDLIVPAFFVLWPWLFFMDSEMSMWGLAICYRWRITEFWGNIEA